MLADRSYPIARAGVWQLGVLVHTCWLTVLANLWIVVSSARRLHAAKTASIFQRREEYAFTNQPVSRRRSACVEQTVTGCQRKVRTS